MAHTYNEHQKDRIAQMVYNWLKAHRAHSGEMAAQDDDCTIDAIDLVCDLADIKDVINDDDNDI